MDFLNKISGTIVFDMDEVLVDIMPKFFDYVLSSINDYAPFLDSRELQFSNSKDINFIREESDIREFLFKKEYRDLSFDEKRKIIKSIRNLEVDKKFWKSNFYFGLHTTDLGNKIMESSFIEREDIKQIVILTFSTGKELTLNKKKYVDKHLNHKKIKLIPVSGFGNEKAKKSDFLKKNKISWDVFVDDMIFNIKDFVENFSDINGKKFFMPEFSYNKIDEKLMEEIKLKGASLEYYKTR
jgi:hypothetical protein